MSVQGKKNPTPTLECSPRAAPLTPVLCAFLVAELESPPSQGLWGAWKGTNLPVSTDVMCQYLEKTDIFALSLLWEGQAHSSGLQSALQHQSWFLEESRPCVVFGMWTWAPPARECLYRGVWQG